MSAEVVCVWEEYTRWFGGWGVHPALVCRGEPPHQTIAMLAPGCSWRRRRLLRLCDGGARLHRPVTESRAHPTPSHLLIGGPEWKQAPCSPGVPPARPDTGCGPCAHIRKALTQAQVRVLKPSKALNQVRRAHTASV